MSIISGVRGNTYGLDIRYGMVYIGDIAMTNNSQETQLFLYAYRIGRDHKKMEIREALDI